MHGPPLTPKEAVASVARQVRRIEAAGVDRDQAIRRVAADNGIEPDKVRWCADGALGSPNARPIGSGRHPLGSKRLDQVMLVARLAARDDGIRRGWRKARRLRALADHYGYLHGIRSGKRGSPSSATGAHGAA